MAGVERRHQPLATLALRLVVVLFHLCVHVVDIEVLSGNAMESSSLHLGRTTLDLLQLCLSFKIMNEVR